MQLSSGDHSLDLFDQLPDLIEGPWFQYRRDHINGRLILDTLGAICDWHFVSLDPKKETTLSGIRIM
jgi:hypothetical protein